MLGSGAALAKRGVKTKAAMNAAKIPNERCFRKVDFVFLQPFRSVELMGMFIFTPSLFLVGSLGRKGQKYPSVEDGHLRIINPR